jgi:hypothetical protein
LDCIFINGLNDKNNGKNQEIIKAINGFASRVENSAEISGRTFNSDLFPGLYNDPEVEAHRI